MTVDTIRKTFLAFFEKRGHKIIPSASLVPENDSSVLFTTAGMHPLVPYLLGEPHPSGSKRLANIQKCVRTGDIDEVGDNTHLTFFEMMGNWSLGDYFKEDAIGWSYELLTSKSEGFGLDPKRLYVTVFEGDANAPRDEESATIWQKAGVPRRRIYYLPASKNWWEAGPNGPCGPDTEMYYDLTEEGLGDLTHEQFLEADSKQQVVEIWNDVFMEYLKKDGKIVEKLPGRNVDTGSGLERVAAVLQRKRSVFETDELAKIFACTFRMNDAHPERGAIIADHVRSAVFMIADGVTPSNTERGYVLRRLIRRASFSTSSRTFFPADVDSLVNIIVNVYSSANENAYAYLKPMEEEITVTIKNEIKQFEQTLTRGLREMEKLATADISGKDAFMIFSTYGLPIDAIRDFASEHLVSVDLTGFIEEFEKHRGISRAGAEKKFKGGLSDTSDMSVKYHTATHLLHQALRNVLGDEVRQKGSNITPERLRFDFSFGRKMTDGEKKQVEAIVNERIQAHLPVQKVTLPLADAKKTGALHFFGEKYGDEVNVYYIGNSLKDAYSKEFCGGPHVENTGILGVFSIQKEEAVSTGVRRIKAVLKQNSLHSA